MVVDHITMEVMATIMKTTIAVTVAIDMAAMAIVREGIINPTLELPSQLFLPIPSNMLCTAYSRGWAKIVELLKSSHWQ
jgi:hypothetical protein